MKKRLVNNLDGITFNDGWVRFIGVWNGDETEAEIISPKVGASKVRLIVKDGSNVFSVRCDSYNMQKDLLDLYPISCGDYVGFIHDFVDMISKYLGWTHCSITTFGELVAALEDEYKKKEEGLCSEKN